MEEHLLNRPLFISFSLLLCLPDFVSFNAFDLVTRSLTLMKVLAGNDKVKSEIAKVSLTIQPSLNSGRLTNHIRIKFPWRYKNVGHQPEGQIDKLISRKLENIKKIGRALNKFFHCKGRWDTPGDERHQQPHPEGVHGWAGPTGSNRNMP